MIRVVQLTQDTAFQATVNDHFNRCEDLVCQGMSSVSELYSLLKEDRPDIVLLDVDIPPMGGLSVLRDIRARFASDEVKVVVFASDTASEEKLSDTARLGADYFMQRPVDIAVLETRIRQLVKETLDKHSIPLTRRHVQETCVRFFEQIGIPPNYKGYRYLVEGIWLASLNPIWLNSVTQHLYPAIAQQFEVSAAQVERAMRYALDVTWEKGNVEELYRFFPHVRENKGKPTTSAFIAGVVDLVALVMDQSV